MRLLALAFATALGLGSLGGCFYINTQKWPPPMREPLAELPEGDASLHRPGPEQVSVLRHADPVRIRPAGELSGYPMTFYEKKARLTAGGQVVVAPGGRAEVLWPNGTSIVMFGRGVAWVGSPSRGEPILSFEDLERARLELREGEQVRLVGGALLTGSSGPYLLEAQYDGTLVVHNQSKAGVDLAFREEAVELGPGQAIVLPLLSAGGAPFSVDQGLTRVQGPGFSVSYQGPFDVERGASSLELRQAEGGFGQQVVRGLGVSVRVGDGEGVVFSGLGAAARPAATPQPAPEVPSEATEDPVEPPAEESGNDE